MNRLIPPALLALILLFAVSCGSGSGSGTSSGNGVSIDAAPTNTPLPPTPTAIPTPTPIPTLRKDILASHLSIPAIGIDSAVGLSQTIPYEDHPLPGCPKDDSTTTLTVPNSGIVTPASNEKGLENKAWIFGHSRYASVPQLFFALQNINVGDEVFVDGTDRATQEKLTHQRFVVSKIYIADSDSGGDLLGADTPDQIPHFPEVILQTSIREDGGGKPWLLDRAKLEAKAQTVVKGDIEDRCKYLLLFVIADWKPS